MSDVDELERQLRKVEASIHASFRADPPKGPHEAATRAESHLRNHPPDPVHGPDVRAAFDALSFEGTSFSGADGGFEADVSVNINDMIRALRGSR